MKKYCGIAFLLFSLLFVACKSDSSNNSTTSNNSSSVTTSDSKKETTSPITKLNNEYPTAFSELSIPLIKGAEIQRADKHNHTTGDKFQITFSSEKTPKEIEEYYLSTMQKKGWKVTNSTKKPRELNAYFSICNNGESQLIINAVPKMDNGKTKASMILMPLPSKKAK